MALLWTAPRDWFTKEPATKEKLNDISNNLRYLLLPSVQRVTKTTGTNPTTVSTVFVDLDAAAYALSVELTGGRLVMVELKGTFTNSGVNVVCFDILIDNTTYLSSLTGTPLTNGVLGITVPVASALVCLPLMVSIPAGVLAAGVHTFKPRWRVTAGTGTWQENGVYSQFQVGEQ